ncbi:MAG: BMP family protein [Spirochaetia bacterium]|jgi:basic membrane protein A|nr:BMP family protein [Spirochaetia bacterium]
MRKILTIMIVLLILMSSVAFAAGSKEAVDDGVIKIALVIPSTIDDMAWSQAMYNGIIAVQKEMGEDKVKVDISEMLWNAVDAGSAIMQYASEGYNLVIAHGAQYQSLLNDIAPDFPETTFAYGTGYSTDHPNIFAYDPFAQEGSYLLGMIAGMKTKSNIIGIVGPVESGDAIKFNKGFILGVKATNPEAVVRVAYTGSFGDLVAAGEIAKSQIAAGADILTGTAQQSVGAIRVAEGAGNVLWLSSDLDQSSLAPNTILVAQAYNFTKVVKEMIDSRSKGVLGGKHLPLTLENGMLQLVFNPQLDSELTAEMKAKIDTAKKQIIDGSLKIDIE